MFYLPLYTVFLLSISQTFLIIKVGFEPFNLNIGWKKALIVSLILSAITYFLRQLPMEGLHTFVMVLILAALGVVVFELGFWDSLICSLLGCIILGTIENTLLPLFLLFVDKKVADLATDPWLNVILFLPTLAFLIMLYIIIRKKNIVLFDLDNQNTSAEAPDVISIIAVLLQAFIILTFSHKMLSLPVGFARGLLRIGFDALVLVLCILSILSIKRICDSAEKRIRLNMLKDHLNQTEMLMNTLSAQKHEFSRHLQAIQSFVYLELYDEVRAYLKGLTENQLTSTDKLIDTGHPMVTNLINTKRILTESMGIKFAVSITCDLSNIDMKPWDLCSVLGNVIDNAIEAASLEENNPRIAVEFKSKAGDYEIYVHNNGSRISSTGYQHLFDPGYTTKDSQGRGYGLYLTKTILNQYNGDIMFIPGKETCFVIKIPNRGFVDANSNF